MYLLNPAIKKSTFLKFSMCLLVSFGCGKKVNESEGEKETRTPQATTNFITLANDGVTNPNFFVLPEPGRIFLPEQIKFKGGEPVQAKLFFSDGTEYQFHCEYDQNDLGKYELGECFHEGLSMGYTPGERIEQIEGERVRLETNRAEVEAELEILWGF